MYVSIKRPVILYEFGKGLTFVKENKYESVEKEEELCSDSTVVRLTDYHVKGKARTYDILALCVLNN